MSRLIILDTETTGMPVENGHKIVEIGCIEIINRYPTETNFHIYLNPERQVDQKAFEVHGLSDDFLSDKPRFAECAEALLNFIDDADIIAHNAEFDMGFLHAEFAACGYQNALSDNTVIDSLALARTQYPGMHNSLDALCKRFEIDTSRRALHGALLDADLLAKVYLLMTGGQKTMQIEDYDHNHELSDWAHTDFMVMYAHEDEVREHQRICQAIGQAVEQSPALPQEPTEQVSPSSAHNIT